MRTACERRDAITRGGSEPRAAEATRGAGTAVARRTYENAYAFGLGGEKWVSTKARGRCDLARSPCAAVRRRRRWTGSICTVEAAFDVVCSQHARATALATCPTRNMDQHSSLLRAYIQPPPENSALRTILTKTRPPLRPFHYHPTAPYRPAAKDRPASAVLALADRGVLFARRRQRLERRQDRIQNVLNLSRMVEKARS
eukprot:6189257-Pleurochrysis_carterae.AAC.2